MPRFAVEDGRCTALHEVVLEVRAASGERVFFETQVAAFSALPPPEAGGGAARLRPLRRADPLEGDRALANGPELAGSIAVVRRGKATFASKALRAQAAGASAVVCVQTAPVWPYTMQDSTGEAAKAGGLGVPLVMVRAEDGARLLALMAAAKPRPDFEPGPSATAVLRAKPLDANCPVCQEGYELGTVAVKLPCRHLFHEQASALSCFHGLRH